MNQIIIEGEKPGLLQKLIKKELSMKKVLLIFLVATLLFGCKKNTMTAEQKEDKFNEIYHEILEESAENARQLAAAMEEFESTSAAELEDKIKDLTENQEKIIQKLMAEYKNIFGANIPPQALKIFQMDTDIQANKDKS